MHTETTDTQDVRPIQGWVGYDNDCGLCVGLLKRFGGPYERRGFVFLPLQNPWLAERLGLKPSEMPEEMKLLWPDDRVIGGAEAIVALLSAVWWSAPAGWIAWLPPLRPLTRAAYRWIARHRHDLGICRIPGRTGQPHHGHTAFFETP